MEKLFEPNYTLDVGDVVFIRNKDYGFIARDIGKYAEVVGKGDYFGRSGVQVKPYGSDKEFFTATYGNGTVGVDNVVGYESFGKNPMILLNTLDENVKEDTSFNSSLETRKDGKVLMDLVETGFPHSMNALGELLTWAANNKGYLANDWKGLDTNSFLGAAARHRNWRLRGVERDHESNLYHLTHELFNVLAQLELQLIKDQA